MKALIKTELTLKINCKFQNYRHLPNFLEKYVSFLLNFKTYCIKY